MRNPTAQALLLRLHRWTALILAIPLATIIVTGFILSFSPIKQSLGIKPASLTLTEIERHLARYDPQGKARGVIFNHSNGTMAILGSSRRDRMAVDLKTGELTGRRHWFDSWVRFARPLHEHFVYDLDWLVPLSTAAMIVSMLLGMLMGWPRWSNRLSGWHKVTAWGLLPLLILSPFTGLLMTYRITLAAPAPRSKPMPVLEVLRMTARQYDPSTIVYIRRRGPRQMVMINTGASQALYRPTSAGLKPLPPNLPRIFHQGDFLGIWGGVMNVILSLAFIFLLTSGLWVWGKRTFRRRRVRPAGDPAASAH